MTLPWQATTAVALLAAVAMPPLARRLPWSSTRKPLAYLALAFAVHNVLLWRGLSLRGDLLDQLVLLAEWCAACLAIAHAFLAQPLPPPTPSLLRTALAMAFNLLAGLVFVACLNGEFDQDRVYAFAHDGIRYETRRSRDLGWAWSANVRYDFETYRLHPALGAERKVHDYGVMSHCSRLDFDDSSFRIAAIDSAGRTLLEFRSGENVEHHAFAAFPGGIERNIQPAR